MQKGVANRASFKLQLGMHLLSTARRSFVLCAVVLAAYWIVLCISTHLPPHTPVLHLVEGLWDKSLHFSAFFGLAVLIALAWAVQRQGRHSGTRAETTLRSRASRFFSQKIPLINYVLIWTIVVAYGSVDEPTQTDFGRTCDVYDLLADTIGATFGLICFAILMRAGRWYFGREDAAK